MGLRALADRQRSAMVEMPPVRKRHIERRVAIVPIADCLRAFVLGDAGDRFGARRFVILAGIEIDIMPEQLCIITQNLRTFSV